MPPRKPKTITPTPHSTSAWFAICINFRRYHPSPTAQVFAVTPEAAEQIYRDTFDLGPEVVVCIGDVDSFEAWAHLTSAMETPFSSHVLGF